MAKTVSVAAVVPAYNSAQFLPGAIASIRQQTAAIDEIIVVDDGSTDDTAAVVRRLGSDIRYIRQDNSGPSAARNAGIEAARSHWIALLDADDTWVPDKTRRQLALAERFPDLALIASDRSEVDATGTVIVESLFQRHGLGSFFAQLEGRPIPDALARLVEKNFIPTSSVLVKREVVLNCGGFRTDLRFSEDMELWCRIAARHPIACVAAVLTVYRRHGANAVDRTEDMMRGLIKTMTALRADYRDLLREARRDPDELVARQWANLGYYYFDQTQFGRARRSFLRSLREKPNRRAALYLMASLLPPAAVRFGRQLKQAWSGR